jgi:hypothetical protein
MALGEYQGICQKDHLMSKYSIPNSQDVMIAKERVHTERLNAGVANSDISFVLFFIA